MPSLNILLLVDLPIEQKQLDKVKAEVAEIYSKNCQIELKWFEERRDFSQLPKSWYLGDAEGIDHAYIKAVTEIIYRRYHEEIDEVVFLVHQDNWNFTGVWGWNLSKIYNGYGVQQCRFDAKNLANSVGTLYHELHHDHDTFIFTYTGKATEPLVGVVQWDDDVTHGGRYSGRDFGFKYIQYKENQKSLQAIKPLLREAILARRAIFEKKVSILEQIIQLQQQLLVLLRRQAVEKRGDLAIRAGGECRGVYCSH